MLGEALNDIAAGGALVVGVHVRTTSNIPFLHFDLPPALMRVC